MTPAVLRIDGLRVVIWPNDHRPAHVHVKGAEGEAVFNLHCPGGPPGLRESYGFRLADLNRIKDVPEQTTFTWNHLNVVDLL